MENKIKSFGQFTTLMEGGAAIKSSRSIREDEFFLTIEHIKDVLFPLLDLDSRGEGRDYIVIGSAGKKKNPDDLSGDIDIGYDAKKYSLTNGIPVKECNNHMEEFLKAELPKVLNFDPEMNNMKGLNVLSIGWPINKDPKNGIVQIDLIPIQNMKWAKFIYYSPDYRKDESRWKSAHRNWLLSSALVAQREVLAKNDAGEVLDYKTPALVLPSGLYLHTKSFRGKIKPRVKTPYKTADDVFVTDDPQEFIDYALGKGYKEDDVKTFEQVLKIMTSPGFRYKENLPAIKERFIELLKRTDLPIPPETELLDRNKN